MSYGVNAPWGCKPIRYRTGAPYSGMHRLYPIASSYATSLFRYDPIISLADGTIGIGTAGNPARGVFLGGYYTTAAGVYTKVAYWPASTATLGAAFAWAFIADDPMLVFDMQEAATATTPGTALTLADVNININFKSATGSTATALSAYFLDNATEAVTATLNFKILGLEQNETNKALGVTTSAGVGYANWEVCWNTHELLSVGTTGL